MKAFMPLIIPLMIVLSAEVYFPVKWIIEGERITRERCMEKTFCSGWEDGYCEGYRDVKGKYAICPVTPVCPVPEVDKTTYTDGYNAGFKRGTKDAKE